MGKSELLTKREAAWRAGRHPRTIENWVKTGKLDIACDDGMRVWFRPEDVDRCLETLPSPRKLAPFRLTGEQRKEIAIEARRRYEAGTSIRQLAVTLDLTEGVVRNLLKEAGTDLRPQSDHDKPVHIYALLDLDGAPRYVGQTNLDPELRSWRHWEEPRRNYKPGTRRWNPDLQDWLLTLERRPDTRVLEIVPYEQRLEAEQRWTLQLHEEGADLLNHAAGAKMDLLPKGKESLARRTKPKKKCLTPEERAELTRKLARARWADPVIRARMQANMRKAKRTAGSRKNIGDAQKRKWENPEYKEKQLVGVLKRYECECGLVTTPGPMGAHLKSSKHKLLEGEIGKSRTSVWRKTGSTKG